MKNRQQIEYMTHYCEKIMRYMREVKTYEMFIRNEEKVDAVTLNLEQIGEAATKIDNEYLKQYETIPWGDIKGMRIIISHKYPGLNQRIIYDTAIKDIPILLQKLNAIIVE